VLSILLKKGMESYTGPDEGDDDGTETFWPGLGVHVLANRHILMDQAGREINQYLSTHTNTNKRCPLKSGRDNKLDFKKSYHTYLGTE